MVVDDFDVDLVVLLLPLRHRLLDSASAFLVSRPAVAIPMVVTLLLLEGLPVAELHGELPPLALEHAGLAPLLKLELARTSPLRDLER